MTRMTGLRTAISLLAACAITAAGMTAASASAGNADPPAFEDGKAKPVYVDDEVIRQDVWVQAPTDTDGDGERDRVHVEVARPASTNQGVDLPVILQASPYYGGGNPVTNHNVDVPLYAPDKPGRDHGPDRSGTQSRRTEAQTGFTGRAGPSIGPSRYEEHFLQRGFIFVYAESLGTGASTGCPSIGDADEVGGIKAVVDWLNGRAEAYDVESGGDPVEADWTTGQTGMIGVSYNGTLPNGVAATGVDGLEAIVPISAISSWYNYYRANGLVVAPGGFQGEDADVLFDYVLTRDNPGACDDVRERLQQRQDRLTGDYSPFWDNRNYVDDAANVDAAVLVSHGVNDHNVKTQQFAQWYDALEQHGVPRKVWLHQRGHGDWPYNLRQDAWLDTLNRWWTHWLHDVENDVMDGPRATIEREDGSWETYADWPDPSAAAAEVNLTPGGRTSGGFTLRNTPGKPVIESLTDEPSAEASELAAAESSQHRLVYRTDPLQEPLRVSGATTLDLRMSFDSPAANITAMLVDYAPDGSVSVVNRGWIDPQNRKSRSSTFAVKPGTPYRIDVTIKADDHVFQPGHRMGVVLLSSDHDYTKRPPGSDTRLSVDVAKSSVTFPLVGGASALDAATGG